jgi:hypothetical protein
VFNADGTPWLEFDLRADPFEQHNLAPPIGNDGTAPRP